MNKIVNPYIAGAPVTETRMFFGREDIFEWIQNSLTGRYADHILVIHGQRRVGKTSVLKQLGNRLPERYIPVFFDLQGRTHTTLDRFLWWLAREIVRVLKQDRNIEIPLPEKEAFSADLEYFENQFLPSLHSALGGNTLLLTFDEFDNLEETEIKEVLGRPLIDYLRRMMGNKDLNFIFSIGSSGRKLENMQAAYTDFFKTALYKKISFLTEEQTRQLVTQPVHDILEYDRAAINGIYRITGGHPYFTQLTCHELFARCQQTDQRTIREADVEAILEDVVERGTVNLKFVWDEATDIEKWALASLAALDKSDNRTLAASLRKQNVRFSESDLTSGLLHLREKDILTPENHFVIHLLKLWLQKNRPLEQVREELTEVNPIANRYIEIGLEFKNSGQYEKALESFQQALEVSAGNIQAQVSKALVYMDQQMYDKAVVEFEKALTMDDDDVTARSGLCEAHLALGNAAMEKGRWKEAAQSYQRVLAINEEHTEARQHMAEIQRQRAEKALTDGRDEDALNAFAEAMKYIPEDETLSRRVETVRAEKKARVIATQVARSEKEAGAKNWEAAIRTLEEARKLAPDDPNLQKRLEELREKIKESKLASLRTRAQTAGKAEKFSDAMKTWQEYLSLEPQDREKAEGEIAQLKKLVELEESYNEAQRAIAEKHYDHAISLFKEIIIRDENFKDASSRLAEAIKLRRTSRPSLPVGKVVRIALIALGAAGILAAGIFAWLRFGNQLLAMISKPKGEKVCMITEGNAITNDYPWDKQIWDALAAAEKTHGIEAKSYIPKSQFDYIPTIETMVKDGCAYIIASRPSLKSDILAEAGFYPEVKFAIVDYWYGDTYGSTPVPDNLTGLTFRDSEVTDLAGYLAAGMTDTNMVGAFGNSDSSFENIEEIIKNFIAGVSRYNNEHKTDVKVSGWDGDFKNLSQFVLGKGEDPALKLDALLKDGASIVFIISDLSMNDYKLPNVALDNQSMLIGYNFDWAEFSTPKNVILTSVVRNPGVPVAESIKQFVNGTLKKGTIEGTLENGGVGLAPYHDFESVVPANLKAELEQLKQEFIASGQASTPSGNVSLEYIQRYVATTPPDFEDDFSKVNDSWGQIADGITISDVIKDGTLNLEVEAGTSREKYVLQSSYLNATNFALEYDFYYESGDGGTSLGVGFPSKGLDSETGVGFEINLESQTWLLRLTDSTLEYSGEINESLKGQWAHLQVISSNARLAIFLNGKSLWFAEGLEHTRKEIWIVSQGGQAKIQLDNVKFWNLDAYASSSSTPLTLGPATPMVTATAVPFTWARLNSGQFLPRATINKIIIDPNDPGVMYIGTNNAGIYKSIDGGSSWQPSQSGLGNAYIRTLVISPTNPEVLYVGVGEGGVYKSIDGGVSWQESNIGIESIRSYNLHSNVLLDPANDQHLFYTQGFDFYASSDAGATWQKINQTACPANFGPLVLHPLDSQVVFTTSQLEESCQEGTYRSQDGGKTWEFMGESFTGRLFVNPDGSRLFASGQGQLMLSSDNGITWQVLPTDWCASLVFAPGNEKIAYCSTFYGSLMKSTNGGTSWVNLYSTSDGSMLRAIALPTNDPDIIWAGGNNLLYSNDAGKTWSARNSGLGGGSYSLVIDRFDNSILYADVLITGGSTWTYRSLDRGSTWELIEDSGNYAESTIGLDAGSLLRLNPNNDQSFLFSKDHGDTWTEVSLDKLPSYYISPAVDYRSGENGLELTTDGGQTWTLCGGNWTAPSWVIDPNNPSRSFIFGIEMSGGTSGLMESTDFCASWSPRNNGLQGTIVNTIAIDPNDPETLYAGMDSGAYVSFDGGKTWVQINNGLLGATVVYSIVVDKDNNVYAATPYGIFKLEGK